MHSSVLLNEAIQGLNIYPEGIYVDGTFGFGGHSKFILNKLNKYGKLLAFDCDPESIIKGLNIKHKCFNIIHSRFSNILNHIVKLNLLGKVNGIILDLGLSSIQINNVNRGFSFFYNSPLDMRMDITYGKSASEWISKANINNIYCVLKKFGEERFSKIIAKEIYKQKFNISINTTFQLVNLINKVIPFYEQNKHPATRTFQAIRIYINNELSEIKKILNNSLKILNKNGRLVIITFHSLEYNLIKNFILNNSVSIYLPIDLPITKIQLKKINIKYKKLKLIKEIKPTYKEIFDNFNSRSATLFVIKKN